jgi:hypothetical protein
MTVTVPGAETAGLAIGQTLQGTVVESGGDLFVLAAGVRAPLPPETSLQPGQAVTVEVRELDQGIQLRVTPQAMPSAQPPAAGLNNALAVVFESIRALYPVQVSADVLHSGLPATTHAVRPVLSMFADLAGIGEDMVQILQSVEQASAAGVLPSSAAESLSVILGVLDPGELRRAMEQLAHHARRSVEGRLATLLSAGNLKQIDGLQADLRAQLMRLMEHPDFQQFLRQSGQQRRFGEAAGRLLDRLVGMQLQNLQGVAHPYAFVEIPFHPDTGIRRAQVHFLGEGKGRKRELDTETASIALDVNTTRLGDLWITLQVARGCCFCRFLAASPKVRDALSAAADELKAGLRQVGYPRAEVEVCVWDGDRIREIAAIVRRFEGVNLQA